MSWTKQRERVRPWLSRRSCWTRRPEFGVLARDHLGKLGGRADDDPGATLQRAVGGAAQGALIDMAFDRGRPVRCLVILGDLPFAREVDRADGDRRAVGVELPQPFLSGQDPGGVELLLKRFLEVEHRVVVGDGDLDSEAGLGAIDDLRGHRCAPRWVR